MKLTFWVFLFSFILLESPAIQAQNFNKAIINGVERFTKAQRMGRFNLAVDMMHPIIVEKAGGKENMIVLFKREKEMKAQQGFEIFETTTLMPLNTIRSSDNMHCLVPQLIGLQLGEARFNSKQWVLASSPDEGKTWYFLNLDAYNNENIKLFFPNWNEGLIIPEPEPAVMIEEGKK